MQFPHQSTYQTMGSQNPYSVFYPPHNINNNNNNNNNLRCQNTRVVDPDAKELLPLQSKSYRDWNFQNEIWHSPDRSSTYQGGWRKASDGDEQNWKYGPEGFGEEIISEKSEDGRATSRKVHYIGFRENGIFTKPVMIMTEDVHKHDHSTNELSKQKVRPSQRNLTQKGLLNKRPSENTIDNLPLKRTALMTSSKFINSPPQVECDEYSDESDFSEEMEYFSSPSPHIMSSPSPNTTSSPTTFKSPALPIRNLSPSVQRAASPQKTASPNLLIEKSNILRQFQEQKKELEMLKQESCILGQPRVEGDKITLLSSNTIHYQYKDGTVFVFEYDPATIQVHGFTSWTFPDGTVHRGSYVQGKPHGEATVTYGDGSREKITYNMGEIVDRVELLSPTAPKKTPLQTG